MAGKNIKTPAMILQEFAIKNKYRPPHYEIMSSISGTHDNRFDYRVSCAGVVAQGTGPSKQIGKHNAAQNALAILKEKGLYTSDGTPVQEFKAFVPSNSESDNPFKTSPNFIGPLKELCLEYKIPYPIFTMISDIGPPHSREFTYECCVASIKTVATGNTKKMAKQVAANEMLERIKDTLPDIVEQLGKKDEKKDRKAITDTDVTETDVRVVNFYNEFYGTIVPNKTIEIGDYSRTLKNIMKVKDLNYSQFTQDLYSRTEEGLKSIIKKLEIKYKFYEIQDSPFIVALSLNTDTPFTVIGISDTLEAAKSQAITEAFQMMQMFMQLE